MGTRPKTYNAEAVFDLPTPLRLRPEALGALRPAMVGGLEVHVVLPDFRFDGIWFSPQLHRRSQVDWLGEFSEREGPEDEPDALFGDVTKYGPRGKIREFWATRVLILPKAELTRAQARRLRDDSDRWLDLLALWIEVVYRQDLQQELLRTEYIGKSAQVWLGNGGEGERFGERRRSYLNLGKRSLIGKREWSRLVVRASAGARPPEAHVFLRDARHAMNIGHHRRSVLDSATAAELSLAKLRDDLLSSGNQRLASYVGKEVWSLSAIAKFLRAMNQSLPDIKKAIVEPRNKAIHQGHEPDEATAAKALATADEVVGLAFPWKTLL